MKLLDAPNLSTPIGLRDRAMLEVLYSSGLRVSELLNLRIADIDRRVGCVRCIGKGDKERLVPIGRKAIEAVEQYLAHSRPKFARPSKVLHRTVQALFLTGSVGRENQPRAGFGRSCTDYGSVQLGLRGTPDAAQIAPQFCHAPSGRRCGPPLGSAHAGPCGYCHDSDLHACGRGASEANLQGASPACVKARIQITGTIPWTDRERTIQSGAGRAEFSCVPGRGWNAYA